MTSNGLYRWKWHQGRCHSYAAHRCDLEALAKPTATRWWWGLRLVIVHRYWAGDEAEPFGPWGTDVLRNTQSHAQIIDWTEDLLPPALIDLADACMDQVKSVDAVRHRANIIRYWLLNQYGGWWVDHDLVPLVSFESLPFPAIAAHGNGEACGCWLAFPERHAFLARALDAITLAPPSHTARSCEVSGSQLIDRLDPDVRRVRLWIDTDGVFNEGASPWAIHAALTSARRRYGL